MTNFTPEVNNVETLAKLFQCFWPNNAFQILQLSFFISKVNPELSENESCEVVAEKIAQRLFDSGIIVCNDDPLQVRYQVNRANDFSHISQVKLIRF